MGNMIEALFDGEVFRPAEPITLRPNTQVWINIETKQPDKDSAQSFLRTARSLNLDGPPDWSLNFEHYLYGDKN